MCIIDSNCLANVSRKGKMEFHYGSEIYKSGFKKVDVNGYNDYGSHMFDRVSGVIRPVSSIHSEQLAGKRLIDNLLRHSSRKKRWRLL